MKRLRGLKESDDPYFVFPLQLEHDYSIISYSPFSGLEEPIRLVIKSFVQNAGTNTRLVFKTHPLDTGIKDWERLIFRWASEEGISGRIDFFDGGNLDDMIGGAQGMITVNSTAGTLCNQWQVVHENAKEFQRERLTPEFYEAFSAKLGPRSKVRTGL